MKTYTEAEVADCRKVSRQGEIIAWCEERRPDIVNQVKGVLESESGEAKAIQFLLAIAFAAGREFQATNHHISTTQTI